MISHKQREEKKPLVFIPTHSKLTQVPKVINNILHVVGRPQGSYADSLVSMSLLLADI